MPSITHAVLRLVEAENTFPLASRAPTVELEDLRGSIAAEGCIPEAFDVTDITQATDRNTLLFQVATELADALERMRPNVLMSPAGLAAWVRSMGWTK